MAKKSIWERIDESDSLQVFFIFTMIMASIAFLFGLTFLGFKLLAVI